MVIGRGDMSATILIIGEAPGKSEDVLGKAFIGESGKLLDNLLTRAGVPVEKCFFTNTVLCRSCDTRDGENREPTPEEIFNCIGNVTAIIPRLTFLKGIVFAGKVAKQFYKKVFIGLPHAAIIHPAALLRQGGTASSFYRDDLNELKEFYAKIAT